MQNQPLVSIIVISYNHSRFIKENLDSIKAQTYSNIELIVGDDASQDNSVEVFEEWLKDNHYTAAFKNYHQVNTGLATMLNECIEKANGKYLKLIAADDFLHPESIEKCVAKLEEEGEECGMVFTDTYIVNEASVVQNETKPSFFSTYTREQIAVAIRKSNGVTAPSVLLSACAMHKTGPYLPELLVEDYHRWLIILQKYNVRYLDEKLCFYRWHKGNVTKEKRQRIAEETALLKLTYLSEKEYSRSVNDSMKWLYRNFGKVPRKLAKIYQAYPHRNKKISFFLFIRIPYKYYIFLSKIYQNLT